jgi:hypothetical protein
LGAAAYAAAIPGLYNTGVDNSNALLAGGASDPHWTVIYGGGPTIAAAVVMSDGNLFGGGGGLLPWMLNGPNSKWISIADSVNVPTGLVTYEIMFDLTGFDPSSAVINGSMTADANVVDVLINGAGTSQSTGFNQWDSLHGFTVNSGFQSGLNVLSFEVLHEDGVFDAFRAQLSGTATTAAAGVPEPGTLILMGAGLVVAASLKRRYRPALPCPSRTKS